MNIYPAPYGANFKPYLVAFCSAPTLRCAFPLRKIEKFTWNSCHRGFQLLAARVKVEGASVFSGGFLTLSFFCTHLLEVQNQRPLCLRSFLPYHLCDCHIIFFGVSFNFEARSLLIFRQFSKKSL